MIDSETTVSITIPTRLLIDAHKMLDAYDLAIKTYEKDAHDTEGLTGEWVIRDRALMMMEEDGTRGEYETEGLNLLRQILGRA